MSISKPSKTSSKKKRPSSSLKVSYTKKKNAAGRIVYYKDGKRVAKKDVPLDKQ